MAIPPATVVITSATQYAKNSGLTSATYYMAITSAIKTYKTTE